MTGTAPAVIPVKPKPEPIDNTELVETWRAEGGHVYHRPSTKTRRGVTFAYKVKGRRMELATAVQHSADTFTKKIGTKTAIDHFHAGKFITLPLVGQQVAFPTSFLKYMLL